MLSSFDREEEIVVVTVMEKSTSNTLKTHNNVMLELCNGLITILI